MDSSSFLGTPVYDKFPNFHFSYLCNKLGNSIFFRIRHGIFDRDDSQGFRPSRKFFTFPNSN
jgi:hypothetical protein